MEGVTGWSIGNSWKAESDPAQEIASLYDKLESVILPMFYEHPYDYASVRRSSRPLAKQQESGGEPHQFSLHCRFQ